MNKERLSVCLFGPHLFYLDGCPYCLRIRGKTLELLRYLILHAGREIRREFIADLLWRNSSERQQRSALNSAVWRSGKKLPRHPGIALHVTESTVCFEIDDGVPVDTRLLTDLVHEGSSPDGMNHALAERMSAALDASESSFMNGRVEDWALSEQERVLVIRLRGLTLLMHWYGGCRRYEDALEVGRRLIIADPFRETAQIDVMWLYVLNGQRVQALKHYQAYAELLERELGIEPMVETRALYDHIRCDLSCGPPSSYRTSAAIGDPPAENHQLDRMLVAIEQSRRELYQVLREHLGSPPALHDPSERLTSAGGLARQPGLQSGARSRG